jgi:hypothetical protein
MRSLYRIAVLSADAIFVGASLLAILARRFLTAGYRGTRIPGWFIVNT